MRKEAAEATVDGVHKALRALWRWRMELLRTAGAFSHAANNPPSEPEDRELTIHLFSASQRSVLGP